MATTSRSGKIAFATVAVALIEDFECNGLISSVIRLPFLNYSRA